MSGPKLDGHHFTEPCPASPQSFRVPKSLNTAALGAAEHFAGLTAHQIGAVLEQLGVECPVLVLAAVCQRRPEKLHARPIG